MKKLYIIYTENRHGQILVFETKEEATRWAKAATIWGDEEIEQNIEEVKKDWRGMYNIFPK